MLDWILFVAASAGGGFVWWRLASRSSGRSALYRFLAFELLLGLAFLTPGRWFVNPLSTPQVISWILLAAGLALALLALFRRPAGQSRDDAADRDPEEPPTLPARQGIYRFVRHPFYGAALFLGWGLFAKGLVPVDNTSFLSAFLLTGVSLFLVSAARADETADYLTFGAAYVVYVRSSKMLIPLIL